MQEHLTNNSLLPIVMQSEDVAKEEAEPTLPDIHQRGVECPEADELRCSARASDAEGGGDETPSTKNASRT